MIIITIDITMTIIMTMMTKLESYRAPFPFTSVPRNEHDIRMVMVITILPCLVRFCLGRLAGLRFPGSLLPLLFQRSSAPLESLSLFVIVITKKMKHCYHAGWISQISCFYVKQDYRLFNEDPDGFWIVEPVFATTSCLQTNFAYWIKKICKGSRHLKKN